jgi:hypothetical protein
MDALATGKEAVVQLAANYPAHQFAFGSSQ